MNIGEVYEVIGDIFPKTTGYRDVYGFNNYPLGTLFKCKSIITDASGNSQYGLQLLSGGIDVPTTGTDDCEWYGGITFSLYFRPVNSKIRLLRSLACSR